LVVTGDHETGGLTATNNGQGVIPGASWTSGGHTAANVALYTTGSGSSLFDGYISGGAIDNTDIFRVMNTAIVPEPSSIVAVVLGVACLAAFRKRR
jgi:alkaline phosphatase